MIISDLTNKNLINLNLDAKDSKEAILKLAGMMEQDGKLISKEAFIMDVIRREKESSTGFGKGFAIPHGKSYGVKEPCFAIGRSEKGIRWESFDKKPVNFVILLAVPNEEAGTSHLEILSQISRKLVDEGYRQRLIEAKNEEDIINILTSPVNEICEA
ncbi:MAG: fructose PTS transporter subunit IIA [Bacillota bacterium]|nr:fructose PTS transporter subunit IIA [Bacillota bacterium]